MYRHGDRPRPCARSDRPGPHGARAASDHCPPERVTWSRTRARPRYLWMDQRDHARDHRAKTRPIEDRIKGEMAHVSERAEAPSPTRGDRDDDRTRYGNASLRKMGSRVT